MIRQSASMLLFTYIGCVVELWYLKDMLGWKEANEAIFWNSRAFGQR
jgi:hypothetical protein